MIPPNSADPRSNSSSNNFDFLRFLFVSLVLFYHCFALLLGPGERLAYWEKSLRQWREVAASACAADLPGVHPRDGV